MAPGSCSPAATSFGPDGGGQDGRHGRGDSSSTSPRWPPSAPFAEQWDGPLDLLINNAGVMAPPQAAHDRRRLRAAVRHEPPGPLRPHRPAAARAARGRGAAGSSRCRRSRITAGPKAVLDGNAGAAYNPQQAYSNSKLANLLFALELQRELERARPAASPRRPRTPGCRRPACSPTARAWARTRSCAWSGRCSCASSPSRPRPARGRSLYAATEAAPGSYTGPQRFGETRGRIGPARLSRLAQDERLARKLWHVSEELTGFRYAWP